MALCSTVRLNNPVAFDRLPPTTGRAAPSTHARSTHRQRAFLSLMQACPQVAHEFNSLLLTISAGVMVARDGDPVARARGLELVDTAAQQARLMTRAMIRLSQCSDPALREFNLADVSREITAFGRAVLPTGIALSIDILDPRVRVLTDQSALLGLTVEFFRHAALVLSPGDRVRVIAGTMGNRLPASSACDDEGGPGTCGHSRVPAVHEAHTVLSLRQEHADPELASRTISRRVRAHASELRACLRRDGGSASGGGRASRYDDASVLASVLPRGRACHLVISLARATGDTGWSRLSGHAGDVARGAKS
ncbi:MAG: hypothetical protein K2X32_00315 [Phycisphaerales bacterium]|nr:hypothetical protein [Phycisphaerales bacterium]